MKQLQAIHYKSWTYKSYTYYSFKEQYKVCFKKGIYTNNNQLICAQLVIKNEMRRSKKWLLDFKNKILFFNWYAFPRHWLGIPSSGLLWSLSLCLPLVLWAHAWVFRKSTQTQAGICSHTQTGTRGSSSRASPWNQQGLMEPKGAVSQVTAWIFPRTWVPPGPGLLWSEAPAFLWLCLSHAWGTGVHGAQSVPWGSPLLTYR